MINVIYILCSVYKGQQIKVYYQTLSNDNIPTQATTKLEIRKPDQDFVTTPHVELLKKLNS
jgi:hypothetical protein